MLLPPPAALAPLETRNGQLPHRAHTVGAAHQGNRISLRLRRCILFYIPALAHVGQHYDCHTAGGLRHWPGGEYPSTNCFLHRLLYLFLILLTQYFATKHDESDPRKRMSESEYQIAGNLFTFWEFEGYLKYSPMFYG